MNINWDLAIRVATPIITALFGAWAKAAFDKKSKLISFVGHVSSFSVRNNTDLTAPPLQIGTHTTTIRNAGKKTATNISIAHNILPDYKIYPSVQHEVKDITGGGREILIPKLVPGEEISISYLYVAPLTAAQIMGAIKSDEGFTKLLNVLLTVQNPKWLRWLDNTLGAIGFVTVAYLIVSLIIWLMAI